MKREQGAALFTIVLAVSGVFAVIYLIKGLLLFFILPFLFAYLLNPFVNGMERHGLSRGVGTLLLFLTISLILSTGILLLRKPVFVQVGALRNNADIYAEKIDGWIKHVESKMGLVQEDSRSEKTESETEETNTRTKWMKKAARILPGVFFGVLGSLVSLLTIVPLITFFLLRDGRNIRRGIISLVPNKHFERVLILQYEISLQIGKYLRGELTRSIIVGTLITIGLWVTNGPYPILLGVFAGITNVIPFVGPYIGAAPALLIVLFSGTGPDEANLLFNVGSVALVYVVSQTLDMMLINPLVLGKSVELHPLIIVLSLLIGVEFLGIIGMVLAVPFSSILKVVFVQLYQSQRRIDLTLQRS
jgi:predicted PurR-regulated permease PerM